MLSAYSRLCLAEYLSIDIPLGTKRLKMRYAFQFEGVPKMNKDVQNTQEPHTFQVAELGEFCSVISCNGLRWETDYVSAHSLRMHQ